MSEKTLNTRIVMKHDVENNWKLATNFSPKNGEIIVYDVDATHFVPRLKVGDGNTNVNNLPFLFSNSDKIPFVNITTKEGVYTARISDYTPLKSSMFIGKVDAESTSQMQITVNDETKRMYTKDNSRIPAGYLKANDFALFVLGSSGWFVVPLGGVVSEGGSGSIDTSVTADQIHMSATDTTTVAQAIASKADEDHTHDGQYAVINHDHDTTYAQIDHDHNGTYALEGHTHNYAGSSSAGGAATSANKVNKAVTFNNGGSGAASGTTFDGSTARTISYNTIGAAAAGHNHDDDYAAKDHNHEGVYAVVGHNHDGDYATTDHTHNYAGSSSVGGAATSANKVNKAITFNNGGKGVTSGTTFDGSTARTISYNTIGAAAEGHNHDSAYAAIDHNHGDTYAATNHTHDGYVLKAGDTMEGTLVGAATPAATVAFRNIFAGTEEVSGTLQEGTIYIQYI